MVPALGRELARVVSTSCSPLATSHICATDTVRLPSGSTINDDTLNPHSADEVTVRWTPNERQPEPRFKV